MDGPYHDYFEHMPAQVLVEDFTAFEPIFEKLKRQGVDEFVIHLREHPELERKLLSLLRLVAANQAAIAAMGCKTLAELQTRIATQSFMPFRNIFRTQMRNMWAGMRLMEEELQYRDDNGRERACLMRCFVPERSGRQDLSRVELVLVDVTAAKWTSVVRGGDQELMRRILARANILLWWAKVWRDKEQYNWKLSVPPQSLDSPLYQLATAADLGGMWDRDHALDHVETIKRSSAALDNNLDGYQQEFRILGKDKIHWLAEDVGIQKISDHEWSLSGVVIDVTQRHEAELELAAEKERLSVTLRAMGEGVITSDKAGLVQFLNPAAASLLGIDAVEAVGRPLTELLLLQNGVTGGPVESPTTAVLKEGILVELPIQTVLKSLDGESHRVEGCCASVRDSGSLIVGTVLVLRDITDRHRLEEELQRASRMESIGILAGGIAHDFNNILTAIMGNMTLARLDAESLPAVQESLVEAQKAVIRARDLTQQLLTFAKGGDPVRAAVQLREVVAEVARFALHGSRVRCEFDLADNLWPVNADKGQVGQVVQNLVINSIQAMPEGGRLRIVGRNVEVRQGMSVPLAPGLYVLISVEDSGIGIKPEDKERIFDPFYSTKCQGSGLGLAMAYSIVKKHKGHIEVESELGQGTVFKIWLPAMPNARPVEETGDKGDTERLTGRVLFMDDEPSIRRTAAALLKRGGMEVEETSDGESAVAAYARALSEGRPFNLVVMDLTVPGGMGGLDAFAELRRIDPGVKAIVSSGYSSNPILANYREHGFFGMVAKPYETNEFLSVVRSVLKVRNR
ncbi:MAG: ATP-binding protein [Opitutaceae bacterium]|jgi:PAS domain S-box-containing protein